MTDRVRVGVVGTGFAASSHLDALARVRGVAVSALLGSSSERTREAAQRLGVDHAVGSLDDLLASVDVVRDLHDAVERAIAAAAMSVTKVGAREGMPARDAIDAAT